MVKYGVIAEVQNNETNEITQRFFKSADFNKFYKENMYSGKYDILDIIRKVKYV